MSANVLDLLNSDGLSLVGMPVVYAEDMRYARTVVEERNGQLIERVKAPIVYYCKHGNVVTDAGRDNGLKKIFESILDAGATAPVDIAYGAVGSDNSNPTDPTQVRLGSELIADTNRRPLTSLDDNDLLDGDFTGEVSGNNRRKVIVKFVYLTSDPNNGQTFAEYGLMAVQTTPGTATTQNGLMHARYVPASSFTKDNSFQVSLLWTMRA